VQIPASPRKKVELEVQIPVSLFKKQRWKPHFRSHFSKSSAGTSGFSATPKKLLQTTGAKPHNYFSLQGDQKGCPYYPAKGR